MGRGGAACVPPFDLFALHCRERKRRRRRSCCCRRKLASVNGRGFIVSHCRSLKDCTLHRVQQRRQTLQARARSNHLRASLLGGHLRKRRLLTAGPPHQLLESLSSQDIVHHPTVRWGRCRCFLPLYCPSAMRARTLMRSSYASSFSQTPLQGCFPHWCTTSSQHRHSPVPCETSLQLNAQNFMPRLRLWDASHIRSVHFSSVCCVSLLIRLLCVPCDQFAVCHF